MVDERRDLRQTERFFDNMPNGGGLVRYFRRLGRGGNGRRCKFHHVCMRCLGEGHTVKKKKRGKCKSAPISK